MASEDNDLAASEDNDLKEETELKIYYNRQGMYLGIP